MKPDFFMHDVDEIKNPSITIYKALRIMEVYDGETLLARMRIALGKEPVGQKLKQGDGKTPEGAYHTCVRNDKSRYHLAIGLSYPNKRNAGRGLADGIIDQCQYDKIAEAALFKKRPPWDTKLGGEIMIHGGGTGSDWTVGCIALDNCCMDYLWKLIENGTAVDILP